MIFKKLIKNKKGIQFLPLFMFILLPLLIYLSYVILGQVHSNDYPLGDVAQEFMIAMDNSEKDNLYLSYAATQSLRDNAYTIYSTGNNPEKKCGSYMGYDLVNNDTENCLDYSTTRQKLETTLKAEIEAKIIPLNLDTNLNIEINNLDVTNIKGTGELIEIPIYMKETAKKDEKRVEESKEEKVIDSSTKVQSSNSGYIWPLGLNSDDKGVDGSNNRITSCIGARNRCSQCSATHGGFDIDGRIGDEIYAVADGVVIQDIGPSYNTIVIDHGTHIVRYLHNKQTFVVKGKEVKQGQKIATLGEKGLPQNQGREHLHIEFLEKTTKTPLDAFDPANNIYDVSNPNLNLIFDKNANCVYSNNQYAWDNNNLMSMQVIS